MGRRHWFPFLALLPLAWAEFVSAQPAAIEPVDAASPTGIAEVPSDTAPVRVPQEGQMRLTIARASDLVGRPMYADRSTVGTSATQVGFSDRPVARVADSGQDPGGVLPLRGARLSSPFGYRRHPIAGEWRWHNGVDLAAPLGTPVAAARAGNVSYAGLRGGYGLLVTLAHGGGLETRYAHLSRISVSPGQTIRAGEILGFVGSTGNSTGPHLHFETRLNGRASDPVAR